MAYEYVSHYSENIVKKLGGLCGKAGVSPLQLSKESISLCGFIWFVVGWPKATPRSRIGTGMILGGLQGHIPIMDHSEPSRVLGGIGAGWN